jgi:hypothetical protein
MFFHIVPPDFCGRAGMTRAAKSDEKRMTSIAVIEYHKFSFYVN